MASNLSCGRGQARLDNVRAAALPQERDLAESLRGGARRRAHDPRWDDLYCHRLHMLQQPTIHLHAPSITQWHQFADPTRTDFSETSRAVPSSCPAHVKNLEAAWAAPTPLWSPSGACQHQGVPAPQES